MLTPGVPPGPGWRRAALAVAADAALGGRWTSLRAERREWLWANPDPAESERRRHVRPGDAFVDAGGVEECFPTVRGEPDHGDAWSRPWRTAADEEAWEVMTDAGRLRRRFADDGGALVVDYAVAGRPGARFVHAVHALLDVSGSARIVADEPEDAVVVDPDGATRPLTWPRLDGRDLSVLGPDDGTATCVVLRGVGRAVVVDGDDALELRWSGTGVTGLMIWRNLGGWPDPAPYRSIGVEPLLGAAAAGVDPAAATLDGHGRAAWNLRLEAWTRGARSG